MKRLLDNKWICKNVDFTYLTNHGCKYYTFDDVYICRFPIDKYKNFTTLVGKIAIFSDGEVFLDVFTEDGSFYSQFYNPTNSCFENCLNKINRKFSAKFKELNIVKIRRKDR